MADELISSLKTISREINDRIKWHELEIRKLTTLRDACEATMNGEAPKGRVTGLQAKVLNFVSEKDAQTPGFTFHQLMVEEWLEHKWNPSSVNSALQELCKKGILEEVGMTDPLKRPGGKTKRQQRIFKVADA